MEWINFVVAIGLLATAVSAAVQIVRIERQAKTTIADADKTLAETTEWRDRVKKTVPIVCPLCGGRGGNYCGRCGAAIPAVPDKTQIPWKPTASKVSGNLSQIAGRLVIDKDFFKP